MPPEPHHHRFRVQFDADATWIGDDTLLSMATGRLFRFAAGAGAGIRSMFDGSTEASWADPLASRLLAAGVAHPVLDDLPTLAPSNVSVVIPFGGGDEGRLRRIVDSVAPARCVVVDDRGGGRPLTLPPGASPVVHTRNRGPAAARNTGWQSVKTPFVAFVDADVVPPQGWVLELVRHFADSDLGLVSPRVRSTLGSSPWHRYEAVRCPLDMGCHRGLVRHGTHRPYVPSTAWVVRRRALEDVGGFDEEMRLGEDVDLVWRLEHAGWRVRYEPDVEVRHEPRSDMRSWLGQRYGYGRSSADLWRKHGAWLRHLELAPRTAAPWVALAMGRVVAGLAVAGASAFITARSLPVQTSSAVPVAVEAVRRQGAEIASYVRRVVAIPLLAASSRSRVARRVLAASFLAYASEWVTDRPEIDPVTYVVLRAADDLAYGAGAWSGALSARDLRSMGIGVRGMNRE